MEFGWWLGWSMLNVNCRQLIVFLAVSLSLFLSVTLPTPALDRKAALISAPLASTYIIFTSVVDYFPSKLYLHKE